MCNGSECAVSLTTLLRSYTGRRIGGVKPEVERKPMPDFERLGLAAAPRASAFGDYDLAQHLPDYFPLQQGGTGSCVAHFWAEAEVLTMAARYGVTSPLPSRRAAYYWARLAESARVVDDGCRPSSLLKAVAANGLPPETAFPWSEARINQRPTLSARWDSRDHVGRRGSYMVYAWSLQDRIDAVRAAVASGRAFGISIPVTADFDACDSATPVRLDPKAAIRGYHMLTGLGCSGDGVVHALNHWGPNHGVSGQVWLAPDYLAQTSSIVVVDPERAVQ